jgi:hypothetical protein
MNAGGAAWIALGAFGISVLTLLYTMWRGRKSDTTSYIGRLEKRVATLEGENELNKQRVKDCLDENLNLMRRLFGGEKEE